MSEGDFDSLAPARFTPCGAASQSTPQLPLLGVHDLALEQTGLLDFWTFGLLTQNQTLPRTQQPISLNPLIYSALPQS
jgi:hypothetical protein